MVRGPVPADSFKEIYAMLNAPDTAFMLVAAALVLIMTPGLPFV